MPQTAFRHTPKTGLRALPPKTPTRADLHQEGNDQEQETYEKKILPESVSILPESTKRLTKKSVPNAMSLTKECVSNVESSTVSNVQLFSRPAGLPQGGGRYVGMPVSFGGSFSAVSTPPIARVGSFFRIFRDLHNYPTAFSEFC